ncbi:MAG: hypothetical protein IJV32_06870 [Bacteroidales bacterium]|nr:hypothetical protein [Bacteroidales bacterium]
MKRTVTITLVTMAAAILMAGCRQAPRFWKGAFDSEGKPTVIMDGFAEN